MEQVQVREAVLAIIADIAMDQDVTGLNDEMALREQLDLDSMDFLDIVLELRKRYSVEVPEAEYPQLNTLAGCVTYLAPKLKNK